MAEVIDMPLMSDTMIAGVIAEWHKNVGDTIESGDLLAEIETDKATMEFEAPEDGVLLYCAEKGASIPVNGLLAIIGEADENVQAIINARNNPSTSTAATETVPPPPPTNNSSIATPTPTMPIAPPPPVTSKTDGRLKASPLAKRLAKENQVDIAQISGTGTDGRIIKRDVDAYLAAKPVITAPVAPPPVVVSPPPPPPPVKASPTPISTAIPNQQYTDERVSQMRKTIARRLGESKFSAPHFYLTITVNMDKAIAARKMMNTYSDVKISFNDLVIKAVAMALRQHPAVNSSWLGDVIRQHHDIHIGVAVAVAAGLVVPVVRHTDNKSLSQIATAVRTLAKKAQDRKITPAEMQGNTFTISNLGMFGIDEFTAIINPPDACILAVGKINKVPAVINDEIAIASQMKMTLSCDHRVVDGATGAKFLQTVQTLLEDPMRMLV